MTDVPEPGPTTAVLPRMGATGSPAAGAPTPQPPPPAPTPAESAADAPAGPEVPAPPATPRPPGTGAPGPYRGDLRPSAITAWLVEAARVSGEWTSLSVVEATRTVVLTVATEATFIKWCGHLGIPRSKHRRSTDDLGPFIQAITHARSWTVVVHVHNPLPTQENT